MHGVVGVEWGVVEWWVDGWMKRKKRRGRGTRAEGPNRVVVLLFLHCVDWD